MKQSSWWSQSVFLHATRCKSIDLTEPLCHSGVSNHAAALLSLLNFNCFQAQRVSASLPLIFFFFLISYLRWCLELVRTRVTCCVSVLWPLNPGLTEPEEGPLGKHKPPGMALFRGQRGWGGGQHMCSASFSHPHSLLTVKMCALLQALWLHQP